MLAASNPTPLTAKTIFPVSDLGSVLINSDMTITTTTTTPGARPV